MASRKVIITELGRELICNRCGEYWPADEEFWYRKGMHGLSAWCIACYLESRAARAAEKKAARVEKARAAA